VLSGYKLYVHDSLSLIMGSFKGKYVFINYSLDQGINGIEAINISIHGRECAMLLKPIIVGEYMYLIGLIGASV